MASYFKHPRSPFYYLKVKRKGKWVAISSGVRVGQVDALRRVRKLCLEEEAKELEGETEGGMVGWGWVPVFLRAHFHNSPKTLTRYAEAWTALEVYFEERGVAGPRDVTHLVCFEYPDWRVKTEKIKASTWNTALTELRVLSRVMTAAVQRGYVTQNPCFRLGLKREKTKRKPEITAEQQAIIEKALETERPWMRQSWLVAMCQGFRLSETNCPLDRIDFVTNTISVIGKGGKVHTAPLHPQVRELALQAKAAGRSTLLEILPKKASLRWSQFFRKLGFKGMTFHSTRVTVVTRLARSGASKSQTMAYVGHASETVHDVYLRLTAADVSGLSSLLTVSDSRKGKNQGDS